MVLKAGGLLVAVLVGLSLGPLYAHGFGERTELPAPLGYFLIGAAVTVALSFVIVAGLLQAAPPSGYRRFNLFRLRWLRRAATSPALVGPVKLLAALLLVLVIAAGFAGRQEAAANFAPTFVWVIWWVGMAFVTALLGNLWALVNPWQALFEAAEWIYGRLSGGRALSRQRPYPPGWGMWPALALFVGFVWLQDAFPQASLPNRIAVMAAVYTALTLGGMFVFGKHQWLRNGEAFAVVFAAFARFSPTEARVPGVARCRECSAGCAPEPDEADDGCIDCYECFAGAGAERQFNLRPYAVGLHRRAGWGGDAAGSGRLALVMLLLATVTFDGFSATGAWLEFQTLIVQAVGGAGGAAFNALTLADTLGVLLFPAAFFGLFLAFCWLMAQTAGGERGALELARAFAPSLIPIALAYNIAHFITLLLVQGQLLIPLASDPFGAGWNLLGTAGYTIDAGVIGARVVWFLSVALIVAGHILSVYLAHLAALRTFGDRAAAQSSQYPMLTLMVIYTVASLWIIAQPIVV